MKRKCLYSLAIQFSLPTEKVNSSLSKSGPSLASDSFPSHRLQGSSNAHCLQSSRRTLQHTPTFTCLLVYSVLIAWMAFIKPSLDQHSGTLIGDSAQEHADQCLVSEALSVPLPPSLLHIADFPSLPEQETSSTQWRAHVPSREIARREAARILSRPLPVSSRGASAASVCVSAQPQCPAGGRGRLLAAVGAARVETSRARGGRCVTDR